MGAIAGFFAGGATTAADAAKITGTAATITSAANTVGEFTAQERQARAIRDQSDFDTRLAALQAKDVVARGEEAAQRVEATGRQRVGSERAALAAQGLDIGSGSAADVQADTARMSALDATTLRNNAAREAYGITASSQLQRIAARRTAAGVDAQAYSTLATGAGKTYGLFTSSHPRKTG